MLAVLSITAPIFAIIALGYTLTRSGLFARSDMAPLGKFVLNIALPALLFSAVASNPFAEVFDPAYLVTYAGATLAAVILTALWFRGLAPSRRGVAVLGASMPNSGFIGYPIMLLAFPELAGKILALNMIVENVLIIPACLMLMDQNDDGRRTPLPALIARTATGLIRRPMIIAIIAGLVVTLSGIQLPDVALRLVDLLAAATAPLALFFVGGTLVGLNMHGNRAVAAQVAGARLFLHPALMAFAIMLIPLGGLTLDSALAAPLILSAAMPMIGIYPILAAEKGHEGMASLALLIATTASFVTISALLLALT